MTIFVTGGTGFIGYNLINELEKRKIRTLAFSRKIENINFKKFKYVKFVALDIYKQKKIFQLFGTPKVLIHLAWEGLPNYKKRFHLKKNLPNDLAFLKRAIKNNVKQLIISGTCYEYGKQEGCLDEDFKTFPCTNYGKAKDQLRKKLEKIRKKKPFILQWLRIFYPFGIYQNSKSLLPSLDKAIKKKEKSFGISSAILERDFISINIVIKFILHLTNNKKLNGIINCCSGRPQSILKFVTKYCKKKKSKIKIITNKFLIPEYEPLKFWGSVKKMRSFSFK
tara:strand:+ start:1642 stop:2481 length:840 start_codon:yes stop_codon:yes gene_type:complete